MQKYSDEYKKEAVKRVINGSDSAAKVSRDLGVNTNSLYTWISKYKEDPGQPFVGSGHLRKDDEGLRQLKKQLRDVQEENEILKKAAAYFAKNQK